MTDSSMTHSEIEELGIVDRYALRQLADEQETEFEMHLLDCGQCQDSLESTLSIMSGLNAMQAGQVPTTTVIDQQSTNSSSQPTQWFTRVQSLAAVLVIGCAIILVPMANQQWDPSQNSPFVTTGQGQSAALHLEVQRAIRTKRLNAFDATNLDTIVIVASVTTPAIPDFIDIDQDSAPRTFDVTITTALGESYTQQATADDYGDVTLMLDASKIDAGELLISSQPIDGNADVTRFQVEISK